MEGRAEKPHYHGHRARLRRRFLAGGADALADYELLELLLFQALPRGDAKPLAKRLLAHFDDDFAEVIGAPADRLRAVEGVGEAVVAALKTAEAVALRLMRERMRARDVVSSWRDLLAYCRARIAGAAREQFHILFLDTRNQIIADEQQQTGTVDHAPVYPREVIKRALELSASAIILVHNHPSGDPTPSAADIDITRKIAQAGRELGVAVHDHLVIARGGHTSFRAEGLL
ncbi:MAG: DNA repair protein RadC [Alphaproteobacteria bacterium]|nr:DNA repair protein RadC [Alphaproteobacteria bacterium]